MLDTVPEEDNEKPAVVQCELVKAKRAQSHTNCIPLSPTRLSQNCFCLARTQTWQSVRCTKPAIDEVQTEEEIHVLDHVLIYIWFPHHNYLDISDTVVLVLNAEVAPVVIVSD